MGMSDEGTVTPEVRIRELEEALSTETDRLQKLYHAYEQQEKELVDARAEIEVLEKEIVDREIEKEAMDNLLMEKDLRIREIELASTKSQKRVEHLEPELEKMEEKYSREKDRLGKVFAIAEELDNDVKLAVAELQARDAWYVSHMALFEDLNKAIKERFDMIEHAVETERTAQSRSAAFVERMDDLVEQRAAEMTLEDAKGSLASAGGASATKDEIIVPVGVVEVTVTPGDDGVFGTDDDEINIRPRSSDSDIDDDNESKPDDHLTDEAAAETTSEEEEVPETWDDGEDPWSGA
jgi:septal ring factor EnvC (AmiA/AmiB activator)